MATCTFWIWEQAWSSAPKTKTKNKKLQYIKTINFLVKYLTLTANCCLIFFHGALYCCVRYSNKEYQDEIFRFIIRYTAQKVVAKYGFGYRFHDLKKKFQYSLNSLYLEGTHYKKIVEKNQFEIIILF